MIVYQRIAVSTGAHVGDAGPLPEHLVGLDEATLANLPAALNAATLQELGLEDTGFLPIEVADPPAPAPRWISVYQYLQRFTPTERQDIEASADKVVIDLLMVLHSLPQDGPSLYLDDPETQGGANYLEQAGLIAAGRAAEILA